MVASCKILQIRVEFLTAVVMKICIFWDRVHFSPLKLKLKFRRNMSPPFSGFKKAKEEANIKKAEEGSKGSTFLLTACFIQVSCLVYTSTMTMEAIHFSETSVEF
jgi:hypothetical protein